MNQKEQQNQNAPISPTPEIVNPSLKERIEVLKQENEFDTDPMKENIEKPEIPSIPKEVPEEKQVENPK